MGLLLVDQVLVDLVLVGLGPLGQRAVVVVGPGLPVPRLLRPVGPSPDWWGSGLPVQRLLVDLV